MHPSIELGIHETGGNKNYSRITIMPQKQAGSLNKGFTTTYYQFPQRCDIQSFDGRFDLLKRVEPFVDTMSWPFKNTFGVRYTGVLKIDVSGSYKWSVVSNLGAKVWIKGELAMVSCSSPRWVLPQFCDCR